jgi:hypothetical protein
MYVPFVGSDVTFGADLGFSSSDWIAFLHSLCLSMKYFH